MITSTAGEACIEYSLSQYKEHPETNLQLLYVRNPEMHQIFLLAFLVVAIAILASGWIHFIMTGQVLCGVNVYDWAGDVWSERI